MQSLLHFAIMAQAAPPPSAEPGCLGGYVVVPFEGIGVLVGLVFAATLVYFVRKGEG